MSKGCIDIKCLSGFARSALVRDKIPCTSVMKAISQLDHQDSDISRHCNNHLAHSLCLSSRSIGQLVELCNAINK